MSYARVENPHQRALTLVGVGVLHAAAAWAIVHGLTVAFVRLPDPPVVRTHNTPLPKPEPRRPAPQPRAEHRSLPQPTFSAEPVLPLPPGPAGGAATGQDPGPTVRPLPPVEQQRPAFVPRSARPVGNPSGWVTDTDYPTREFRENHSGAVGFILTVSPQGLVSGCTVTRSSGYPGLDQATCAILSRRARFTPATGEDGQAVEGRFSSTVRWQIPE